VKWRSYVSDPLIRQLYEWAEQLPAVDAQLLKNAAKRITKAEKALKKFKEHCWDNH
jgi:hypothetical protein